MISMKSHNVWLVSFIWLVLMLSFLISITLYIVSAYVAKRRIQHKTDQMTTSVVLTNPSPSYCKRNPKYSSIYDAEDQEVFQIGGNDGTLAKNPVEMFDQGPQMDLYSEEFSAKNILEVHPRFRNSDITESDINIYIINMAKNKDRYKRFKKTIGKSDLRSIKFTRIEGIDGKKLNIQDLVSPEAHKNILISENTKYRKYHYELTRGAVGCYLSHINVYKAVKKQSKKYAFIFEDDVKIVKPNLLQEVNNVIPTIPFDWDILLLGCVCFVCGKFTTYYDVNRYFLMHGYIIKKSSAEKILHMIENEPIEQQIDAKFSDLAERGLLKIYCLRNKLAVQYDMGTNIQIPVKNFKGINPFDAMVEKDSLGDDKSAQQEKIKK